MKLRVHCFRSDIYERELAKQGVEYEYVEDFDLSLVDLGAGLRNQCRLVSPLDDDLVSSYISSMRSGDGFPPVILWRMGGVGKYLPVDGNHRLEALKRLGVRKYGAYVLKTKDRAVVDRIIFTFNNKVNGRRLEREEAIEHAVALTRLHGISMERAAVECGVTVSSVRDAIYFQDITSILARNKVCIDKKLNKDKILRLASLRVLGDDILCKVAEIVASTAMTKEELDSLVSNIRSARDHQSRLSIIEELGTSCKVKAIRETTKNGDIRQSRVHPSYRLDRLLKDLERLLDRCPDIRLFRPTYKHQFKESRESAIYVVDKLTEIFGLGKLLRR